MKIKRNLKMTVFQEMGIESNLHNQIHWSWYHSLLRKMLYSMMSKNMTLLDRSVLKILRSAFLGHPAYTSFSIQTEKRGLLYNNVFSIVGSVLMGCCQVAGSPELLIVGRFVIGISCGKYVYIITWFPSIEDTTGHAIYAVRNRPVYYNYSNIMHAFFFLLFFFTKVVLDSLKACPRFARHSNK